MVTWYSADLHLGHSKIITYSNRPFVDAAEMNRVIIERWNETVGDQDHVWFLGDFCWKGHEPIFHTLKGIKHLIIGNHDGPNVVDLPWASKAHYHEFVLTEDGQTTRLTLNHYGQRVWNHLFRGAIMLYGHSHNSLPGFRTAQGGGTLDVGVDSWNFYPVNMQQIKDRIKTLPEYSAEVTKAGLGA